MAGMLPGVEAARRRRFHSSNNNNNNNNLNNHDIISTCCTTRSRSSLSLCLHAESHLMHREWACNDSRLCTAAREAKQRLDERLQLQRKSFQTKSGEQQMMMSSSSNPLKKMNYWLKLRWKSESQEECAVCLEQLLKCRGGMTQLPCGHRFHTSCLLPWLDANPHCPCCRLQIITSSN